MKLTTYLKRNKETQLDFSRRSKVSAASISVLCNGRGTSARTALKIIRASGGVVRLEDLVGIREPKTRRRAG